MTATIQNLRFEKRASAIGTYWTCKAAASQIRAHLRELATTRFKAANIGGEQESGFEQAFGSLAYAYLKDKSPRLLDYIVGFQLVDRNDDNTKAMGIFGFKVGDQWLYGPVFFLNGDLKGHELLYIKKQDMFVPMKENWVNYLLSRKPHVLGEGSPQNTFQLGGMLPDLSRLAVPPTSTKYSSDAWRPQVAEWARPFLPFIATVAIQDNDKIFGKQAELAKALDLKSFFAKTPSFPLLKSAFETMYMSYPGIKRGFDRFYGADFFKEAAVGIKALLQANEDTIVKSASHYILPPAHKKKGFRTVTKGDSIIPEQDHVSDHPEKTGAMEIIESAAIAQNKPDLTDEEREKLLNDTVLIRDKRDPHAVSMVYNTQTLQELVNPDETGLYEILEKPGSFDEMLFISHPHTGRGRERFGLVVRKSDPRAWLNTHQTNLWTKANAPDAQNRRPEKFREWVKDLSNVDSLKKSGTYIAIHPDGAATCPFRVREDFGEGNYSVSWEDHCQYGKDRPAFLGTYGRGDRGWDTDRDDYRSYDAKISINKRPGCKLRSVRGELNIPSDFKIIVVQDPPKPKKDDEKDSIVSCCMSEAGSSDFSEDKKPIQPGNIVDVQLFLTEKTAALRVYDTGTDVWVWSPLGTKQLTKRAALIHMVREQGVTEQQARYILKEAAAAGLHRKKMHYRVKYAMPFGGGSGSSLQPGPNSPTFPQPIMGAEQAGPSAYNTMYPQEDFMPVHELSSRLTDPAIYDPFFKPDPQAMQVAQSAAQSGQKEVFDTAMISGMLKSVRQDSLVDRHLGDLMKALDKLGRILFMFYWHSEEFEDRYGKQDLPELEDSLRNAFETLGDVVLFLKEKTVQGVAGFNMGGSVGNPSPNIEEAARN